MTDQISSSTLQKSGSGRKVLLAIVAIPAVVLLLSTGLYYMVNTKAISLSTVNNGTLISPPIRLTELSLKTPQGGDYDYSLPEPKWSFIVIAGRDCDQVCERMLYLTRQTHHALERRMMRVKRLYLNYDDELSDASQRLFDDEYKTTDIVNIDKANLNNLLSNTEINILEQNRFYVVDHNGWLMMYYSAADTQQITLNELGKKVVKDMKRLLK